LLFSLSELRTPGWFELRGLPAVHPFTSKGWAKARIPVTVFLLLPISILPEIKEFCWFLYNLFRITKNPSSSYFETFPVIGVLHK